jgi:hypothetical protein
MITMNAIRIVTVVFLALYSARIAQAAHFGVSFAALLPYMGWVSSAVGLATWQVKGLPGPSVITYTLEQVQLMVQYGNAIDPTANLEEFEGPTVPPTVLRRFNLEEVGGLYQWTFE